jgi:GTP pyrophosphokinase
MKNEDRILEPSKIEQNNTSDTDKIVDTIIESVKESKPSANTDMIYVAYRLAKWSHRNQFRKSGAQYIEHPVQVAFIASQLSMDATTITACLLHDVVEDTPYSYEDIEALFGSNVALLVDGVTKLRKIQYNTREEQQVDNLRKMFFAMAKDIRVVIIKLIDRLHNMRTLNFMPRKKQLLISKETLDVYAPLAHRLGMSKIKIELEDLALKYLDPVAYEEIRNSINQKKEEREEYIKSIMDVLRKYLAEFGIEGEVSGRAKHFYSIFRKMYTQNKTLDELYDLFAVRVIVNTVADCYAVLGLVHEHYTPVPLRFKDYIAMPKPNMYQSLHTTVIGPNGTPFEIQIRTWEMHRTAEEGIAAHWKYKEGKSGANDMDSALSWVRQLLDTQQTVMDTDDFFNTLRCDLFSDEVFVFTPQGKVISLPAGSTVIDFAFLIHSQVGCKMSGAKVNGKIVPNSYVLQNGEIVEILTANSHGPSRDWIKLCRTTNAKNKINQWFKREKREENIEHGNELIDRELRKLGNTRSQLFRPEWIEIATRKYGFNKLDDLIAAVGYGGLTAQKLVMRLRNNWLAQREAEEKRSRIEEMLNGENQDTAKPQPEAVKKTSDKGIIVKGIDNCLVRLAHCCRPVAGDPIVGFITKVRGVSVHRADCPNIQPEHLQEEDRGKFIDVEWDIEKATLTDTMLRIEVLDRDGVLMEITNILSTLKIPFKSINANVNKKGIAVISLGVALRNTSDLALLSKKIRQVKGVRSVSRASN